MSVITGVNEVVAKTSMTRVVTIGRDATAVASTRGTVDGRGLITGGARRRAWPRHDEGGWRICNHTSRKRRRRHGGVWAMNAGRKEGGAVANVPLSQIVVALPTLRTGRRVGTTAVVTLVA